MYYKFLFVKLGLVFLLIGFVGVIGSIRILVEEYIRSGATIVSHAKSLAKGNGLGGRKGGEVIT